MLGNGLVFDPLRDDEQFAGLQVDDAIPEMDLRLTVDDKEQFVRVVVGMPHELTFDVDDAHVVVVHCGNVARRPLVIEGGQCLSQVDLVVHASSQAGRNRARCW